jgi:hypothetical protein
MKLNSKSVLGVGLLGLTGLLSACGGGEVIVEPTPTQPTAIFGTLTPFTVGTADQMQEQLTDVRAPISATGNFDFGLPNVAAQFPNLLNNKDATFVSCDAPITGPDGFKSFPISILFSLKGGAFVAENISGSVVSYKVWWFANTAGTLTVNANCSVFGKVNQSLTFTQGWNVVDVSYNGTATTFTRSTDQNPGRLIWKDKKAAQSLASQALGGKALDLYFFNPWAALKK